MSRLNLLLELLLSLVALFIAVKAKQNFELRSVSSTVS